MVETTGPIVVLDPGGTARTARALGPSDGRSEHGGAADAGVTTVIACVCAAALLVITGLAVQFGAVLLARHRAEFAADLAALAGAAVILQGTDSACGRAGAVAAANGAVLQSCEQLAMDLRVTVTVGVRAGPLTGSATGRARAGPVGVSVG